jgi:hypothetical protein
MLRAGSGFFEVLLPYCKAEEKAEKLLGPLSPVQICVVSRLPINHQVSADNKGMFRF